MPEEIREFCAGKKRVLVVEEGYPDYIEQAINVELRKADIQTRVTARDVLPNAGEYSSEVLLKGVTAFLAQARPEGLDTDEIGTRSARIFAHMPAAAASLRDLPPRPPTFCTGCPERPVFSAIKLAQREIGPRISAPISAATASRRSRLSTWAIRSSATACRWRAPPRSDPTCQKRPIAVMGDGGFWHNGVITGVASNLFNKGDGVLIIMQNGYTSATGLQFMPSSKASRAGAAPEAWISRRRCDARRHLAAQGAHLQRREDGQRR